MARAGNRWKRRAASLRGALAAVLLLLAVSPGAAREFRAADSQPPDYPSVEALRVMAGLVAERSGGRHTIRVYDSARLGQEADTVDMTRAGVIDINRLNISTFNDRLPETLIPAMPYLFRDEERLLRVLEGPVGAEILAAFSRLELVGLAFVETCPRSFYTVGGPLAAPADFRGKRLRTLPGEAMAALIEGLGGTAVRMPYRQIGTALATGLIDGAENNLLAYREIGHFRLAPYVTLTRHSFSPGVLVMARKSWDALEPADQRLFQDAAREVTERLRRDWPAREAAARLALAAEGVELAEIDAAPLAAAMGPVHESFAAAHPEVRALLARVRGVP